MDHIIRVKHVVFAVGAYIAYCLLADHFLLHDMASFLSHMTGA